MKRNSNFQILDSFKPSTWWNKFVTTIAFFTLGIVVGYMLIQLGTELWIWLVI